MSVVLRLAYYAERFSIGFRASPPPRRPVIAPSLQVAGPKPVGDRLLRIRREPARSARHRLWCRLAQLKLGAHFLHGGSKRFDLLLLAHRIRLQFLYFAVLF